MLKVVSLFTLLRIVETAGQMASAAEAATAARPSAQYDLLPKMAPFLDPHMVFPFLTFLNGTDVSRRAQFRQRAEPLLVGRAVQLFAPITCSSLSNASCISKMGADFSNLT